jgi:hypothetical protein
VPVDSCSTFPLWSTRKEEIAGWSAIRGASFDYSIVNLLPIVDNLLPEKSPANTSEQQKNIEYLILVETTTVLREWVKKKESYLINPLHFST